MPAVAFHIAFVCQNVGVATLTYISASFEATSRSPDQGTNSARHILENLDVNLAASLVSRYLSALSRHWRAVASHVQISGVRVEDVVVGVV